MKRGGLRRRLLAVAGIAGGLTLLARPLARAGTDVFSNISPASPLGSAASFGRYPLSHYGLDQHFTAISASLTGGVDVSGLLPMIAYFFASLVWLVTGFLAKVLIELFAFAFNLDLVNGSSATGGAGALGPVSQAIHSIYANAFGAPWLVLAFSAVGIWAMWKALVQRRYSETAGALALSLIYIVVAIFFVAEPAQTIGQASRWTNEMSQAFLSISAHGDPSGGGAATADDADQLWGLLVERPWSVLEFGGVEHCAIDRTGDESSDPQSAPVRPLSKDPAQDASLARRLAGGTEVSAEGKTCINNANKYSSHFLRFGLGTDERGEEYDALDHGDSSKLPEADEEMAGYKLGVADKPATDAMEAGGQYQRLLIALIVAVGETGAFLLLGALSIGVILSQVLLLLLLAFSPVALVAAAIPGRGHDFFKAWLEKLGGYLLRKAGYSLVLAVLLAVNSAIADATSQLGWLFAFGLQAAFFWAVLIQRRTLMSGIVGIATGPRVPGGDLALDAIGLYAGARLGFAPIRGAGRLLRGAGGLAARRHGNHRAEYKRAHPAGAFGTYHSQDLDHGNHRGSAPGAGAGKPSANGSGESSEATAGGSAAEGVAVPAASREGKAAGVDGEATRGKRLPANRAQDGSADSASSGSEGGQDESTSGENEKHRSDSGRKDGGDSRRSDPPQGQVPKAGDAGGGKGETPAAECKTPAAEPGAGRRAAGVEAGEVDDWPQPRRGASKPNPARPKPQSRQPGDGREQAGSAAPKGSDLSDDLRAERERAKRSASPPGTDGSESKAASVEPPARKSAAPPPPEEPSSPPRRRHRRPWKRGGRGR